MAFLNAFKDGTMVVNGMPSTGKAMHARKVMPGKILNPAKDGKIFVRGCKPLGAIVYKLKTLGMNPTVAVVGIAIIATVGAGYCLYKAVKYVNDKVA